MKREYDFSDEEQWKIYTQLLLADDTGQEGQIPLSGNVTLTGSGVGAFGENFCVDDNTITRELSPDDDVVLAAYHIGREYGSDSAGVHYTSCEELDDRADGNDPGVRRAFFQNFITNASLKGSALQEEVSKENNCNVPWAILLDPTTACNLNCTGCWAAEYGHQYNLTLEDIDSIVAQGKEMGTYMYIYTGGEPTVRRKDVFKIDRIPFL